MLAEEKAEAMTEMRGDNDAKMDDIAKNGTALLGGAVVAGACALGGCETLIAGGAAALAALVVWAGGNALIDWAAPPAPLPMGKAGPSPKPGGNNKPMTPTVQLGTRMAAEDPARQMSAKGQKPILHGPKGGKPPHYHPTDPKGDPKPKHFDFPKRRY